MSDECSQKVINDIATDTRQFFKEVIVDKGWFTDVYNHLIRFETDHHLRLEMDSYGLNPVEETKSLSLDVVLSNNLFHSTLT